MVLYADVITKSIQETLDTTQYRREKQLAYNAEHGIVPQSVKRAIDESLQTPGKSMQSRLPTIVWWLNPGTTKRWQM